MISPNMQNNNQSISPQPSHLPPSPHDPDHVTNNDSSHSAAEQVGFSGSHRGVVVFCFGLGCLLLLLFASLMCHLCTGNKQHNHSHSVQWRGEQYRACKFNFFVFFISKVKIYCPMKLIPISLRHHRYWHNVWPRNKRVIMIHSWSLLSV